MDLLQTFRETKITLAYICVEFPSAKRVSIHICTWFSAHVFRKLLWQTSFIAFIWYLVVPMNVFYNNIMKIGCLQTYRCVQHNTNECSMTLIDSKISWAGSSNATLYICFYDAYGPIYLFIVCTVHTIDPSRFVVRDISASILQWDFSNMHCLVSINFN